MIGIVDYGMGNLKSVRNAFEHLGADAQIVREAASIGDCERIVLPGVGALSDCMRNLRERELIDPLARFALGEKRPFLGICLGMQVLATAGHEGGATNGLGWIQGKVTPIPRTNASIRVPHIGWNSVHVAQPSPLFDGLPDTFDMFFVHGYHVVPDDPSVIEATFDHGDTFVAALRKDNIFGTQFHPEKSQDAGLQVLENFLDWSPGES